MVEAERDAIVEALRYARGNVAEAARLLMIGRTTLYRKMKSYEIDGGGKRKSRPVSGAAGGGPGAMGS